MISKITTRSLFASTMALTSFRTSIQFNSINFKFALIKPINKVLSDLPEPQLPFRDKYQGREDRFQKDLFYKGNSYQKKDRPAHCRYYALQYKRRIYHVFNAYYYPMGRMIGKISTLLRGKNSPHYRNNHADIKNGDICVIVNARDPLFTGKKLLNKKLKYHTGFVGHLKQFTYSHVLNHKPELLYHYLLRKMMPKNKISGQYLQNLKIYRGPLHDIRHLPQFAPDDNVYEYLPEANLDQYIKMNPNIKILQQSHPGLAKETHGRDFEYVKSNQQQAKQQQELEIEGYKSDKLYKQPVKTKLVAKASPTQYKTMMNIQKKYMDRYRRVSAPYRKLDRQNPGCLLIKDQKKAKKSPDYQILKNQDLIQEEQDQYDDPFGTKAKLQAQKKIAQQNKKKK